MPAVKGDQARSYNQIRCLREQDHDVDLLTFGSKEEEEALKGSRLFRRISVVRPSRLGQLLGCLRSVWQRKPLQVGYYRSPEMSARVQEVLAEGYPDLAVVQMIRMAPYFEGIRGLPLALDLIDSMWLNMRARAMASSKLLSWFWNMEAERSRRYEQELLGRFKRLFVVSERDQRVLSSDTAVTVCPNGIDLKRFPFYHGPREGGRILFFGNLQYFPNVDAALYLANDVFPLILERMPFAKLILVGATPSPRLLRLRSERIEVTGFVPDLTEELNRAQLALLPIRLGSGMQNKLLEAMAAGLPVVSTPFVQEGISAREGEHLLLGSTPRELADAACRVMASEKLARQLSINARRLVETSYSWRASVTQLLSCAPKVSVAPPERRPSVSVSVSA
jgi:polysaccharide biosynthesis protein PslH